MAPAAAGGEGSARKRRQGSMEAVVTDRASAGGRARVEMVTTWLSRRHHVDLCQTSTALCPA